MKWLHLSDLHFNIPGYDNKILKDKFLCKLKELNLYLDFIIITGDILYQYSENNDEIDKLVEYIKSIAMICRCDAKYVFICQGNHDVSRSDKKRIDLVKEFRRKNNKDEFYDSLDDLSNEKFNIAYLKITGKNYESYKVINIKNKPYRIISINSSLLSIDNKDNGKLRICNKKLNEISCEIKKDERLNILIMHHGAEFLREDESRKFIHWMDDNNIDIAFSGHTHLSAAITYDDTYRNIMQFTSGAIAQDGYALPSFYICSNDNEFQNIDIDLFAFSKETDSWELGNNFLRKFKNGHYIYNVVRFNKKTEDEINTEKIKECFSFYNNKYKEKYNTDCIYANKYSGYEEFDSWKIMHSLVEIQIPYNIAIYLTNDVINKITDKKFKTNDTTLSCAELRNVIYDSILNCSVKEYCSEIEKSCWASRYARKYNRNEEILVINENGNIDRLNYHYIKDALIKEVLDSLTYNSIFYEKLSNREIEDMAKAILVRLKNLDIFQIKKEILISLIKEFITRYPHPWVVYKNREEIINYHISQAQKHINRIKSKKLKDNSIQQIEATYHICASIISQYDNYIGCKELSPLRILHKSLTCMNNEEYCATHKLPMQLFQVVQLKKDIISCGKSFEIFVKHIETLYNDIVEKQKITLETTKNALIELWEYSLSLKDNDREQYLSNNHEPIDKVRSVFSKARGFVVKSNLRGLKNAFWVSPFWERHEIKQQNLDNQLLVCLLKNNDLIQSLKEVCEYLKNKKCSSTEVVFAKDDFTEFSIEERADTRNFLKQQGQTLRCIFIIEDDFLHINFNGWRNVLFEKIRISKYS